MFNKSFLAATGIVLALATSCNMQNPFLSESPLPYGAPQFDKIQTKHYLPAIEQGIKEGKADIDAIVANTDAPTFQNTIEAMEFAGKTLTRVTGIFYNLYEADATPGMQEIAEKVSPLMTEYSMYISLNEPLFAKVKAVYEQKDSLGLDPDQLRLLEKTYRGFVRSGANLAPEQKEQYSKLAEERSLLSLQFGKNALAATNAFKLNITDEADLAGLPDFVREGAASTAKENGQEGWTFDLSYPSMGPFMQYSEKRELREKLWRASATKATEGENDNTEVCRKIADTRIKMANLLGYRTHADFSVEPRMVKSVDNVYSFLGELMGPSLPAAQKELADIFAYAKENGFEGDQLMPWDFAFWSEKYKNAKYSISDEQLKPYFKLENCIDAVFGLAAKLYGITFEEREDLPKYHKDVHIYDVKDENGEHLALFYADFFPRATKRSGAWMTSFSDQKIENGVESRPVISIVTNFSKPTETSPSLLTHDELVTFLHEFGHSLHGILAQGKYPSMTGTSVDHDFVELPSQIMENWAFQKEYLQSFAKHYQTGEPIPDDLIDKIIASKNYLAAYAQVRQLQYGYLDMAWHTLTQLPEEGTLAFEDAVYAASPLLPRIKGMCQSTTFSHIFKGGYSAGYYSYKWAEVLEADAFSLFEEKGIFNTEVSHSFRDNILSKGDSEDPAVLYRNFRGHDPEPKALLKKLGIIK